MLSVLVALEDELDEAGFLYVGAVLLEAVDVLLVVVLRLTVLLEPIPLRTVVVLLPLEAVEFTVLLFLTGVLVVFALVP